MNKKTGYKTFSYDAIQCINWNIQRHCLFNTFWTCPIKNINSGVQIFDEELVYIMFCRRDLYVSLWSVELFPLILQLLFVELPYFLESFEKRERDREIEIRHCFLEEPPLPAHRRLSHRRSPHHCQLNHQPMLRH